MQYNVLATGSAGNCVIVENCIALDMGIPFKTIKPFMRDLQLVLTSHLHGDHFNRSTIARLAKERPMLRFGCCEWLVAPLVDCGVEKKNIDVYEFDTERRYVKKLSGGTLAEPIMTYIHIEAFPLFHDVPNNGWKIHINGEKLFFATDTNKILTEAKGYDLYLIEANYEDEEIQQRIENKIIDGKEPFGEYRAMRNHLSQKAAYDYVVSQMGANSTYFLLHGHVEKEDKDE
jgi:ribonuclease BN (tRNA processing enzyme)